MPRTKSPQERIIAWAVHAPRKDVEQLTRFLHAIVTDPGPMQPAKPAKKVARKPRRTITASNPGLTTMTNGDVDTTPTRAGR